MERLEAGESGRQWMTAVRHPQTLPLLESALVAAGNPEAPEAYPDTTRPVLVAIAAVATRPLSTCSTGLRVNDATRAHIFW